MRAAGCDFIRQQPAIKLERSLPTLEAGIKRLAKAPGPHLHFSTSARERAREREGRPRMRMKPSASFWLLLSPMVNEDRSVRYSEYSDSRQTIEIFPLYSDNVIVPVTF